jgi:hypothetical protein
MDERFDDLPDDPEEAFLFLESLFRTRCAQQLPDNRDDNYFPAEEYLEYMSRTLAAATELEIDSLSSWRLPSAVDFSVDDYRNFRRDVEHVRTVLQIRHSRRVKGYSVALDPATKEKIRHYVFQIRAVVDRLDIDEWKKRSLFDKLGAFESEVNNDRTRFEFFGTVVIYASEVLGAAAEKAEPAREWIDSIARLLWGADTVERTKRLPPPQERRRIEPPKERPSPQRQNRRSLDDDIPF